MDPLRVLLRTERLLLCDWSADDAEVLLALSQDPEVMRYFPGPATREQIEQLVARSNEGLAAGRPGLYSVHTRASEPGGSRCIGFVGLAVPRFSAPFMVPFAESGRPCVEIGWRLTRTAWGRGYAPEGARAALAWGFGHLELPRDEIVSFTTTGNVKSQRVMQKIGMRHDERRDFDHPLLPDWHERRHVLYCLSRAEWASASATS